MNGVDSMKNIF